MVAQAQVQFEESRDDLAGLLASGNLSQAQIKRAKALLTQLDTPIRLTLLGGPGAGKSSLFNLLLGQQVMPENKRLPTLFAQYGERPTASVTMANGSIEVFDHADLGLVSDMEPAFVDIALPLPALKKFAILEVVTGLNPVDTSRALAWAAKRTDIAIWCSKSFSEGEQALWTTLPEEIQVQSYLLLEGADANSPQLAQAKSASGEDFKSVLPIQLSDALSARRSDGTIDVAVMKKAGASALISALKRQSDQARQHVTDQIDVFLKEIGLEREKIQAARPAVPKLEPVPTVAPVADPEPEITVAPSAMLASTSEAQDPVPAPEPEQIVTAETATAQAEPLGREARGLCEAAIASLRSFADRWQEGDVDAEAMIAEATELMLGLSDDLSDGADDALLELAETATDAADLCQLIALESGATEVDVLSAMIQVKEELEAALAV